MRPTWSDPFASPCGCLSLAELSKILALLAAPAEITTMSPVYTSRSPPRVTTTPVTVRPEGSVSSLVTSAPHTSVTFSRPRTGRTAITSASDLACTRHG